MKIFFRQKTFDREIDAAVHKRNANFIQSIANNAAKEAVHYYICWRTLDWWRNAISEAEKDGNKYIRLADLLTKIEDENNQGTHKDV